ncbi:hypothetical protein C8R45DRAFT_326820 [Mycena sanguinolenta]|nr:hypothetical protein C8R45DRAFT_326820 [Mycena sanguinolenta]
MHHLAEESSRLEIYGGTGGNGGGGGAQGGDGGPGLGPSFGGMQFVIHNPQLDNVHRMAANHGLAGSLFQPGGASSQLYASGMGAGRMLDVSRPNTSSTYTPVYSESRNYCSQLLRQGRGFPLFVPGPQTNLPAQYRTRGVAIGDVGRITAEGSFDFFFNIYLPANHPINANVPKDFVPLSPYDPLDVIPLDFDPGNYVSSRTVTRTKVDDKFPKFPGGGFIFSCRGPSGAILALPHGAHLEKLENLAKMRRYAEEHAENWYEYVNVTRGRGLVSGHLYLVSGCEKAPSWGMANFLDVALQDEFKLSFGPTEDAANGYKYRWNGNHCHSKQSADAPLDDGTPLNQTTFIHAFAISVGERIWEKVFGVQVCQPVSSTFLDKSGRSFIPYETQGSAPLRSIFTSLWDRAYSGWRQAPLGNGTVTDAFPTPKIIHPSEIIHERIFHEVPQATVVITHDDDWRDVLKDDGIQMQELTASELQQAIFDRFEVLEKDGAVCLRAKSDTTTANAAAITVARDDPNSLSRKGPRKISDEEQSRNYTAEGDIRPHSVDNFRDPVFNMRSLLSPRDRPRAHLANAPVPDADAELGAYLRRQANKRPIAPPLQSAYSNWPQTLLNRTQFAPATLSALFGPRAHESRRGEARDDPGSTSGPDSEDPNPPFSAPRQPHRTPDSSSWAAQPPRRPHRYSVPEYLDSDSDSTPIMSPGPFSQIRHPFPPPTTPHEAPDPTWNADVFDHRPSTGNSDGGIPPEGPLLHLPSSGIVTSLPMRHYHDISTIHHGHNEMDSMPSLPPRRYEQILAGLQSSNGDSYGIRSNSFTGGYPIPAPYATQSRSRFQSNLQSHQLMGSAVEDAFSPVELVSARSIPSSPTHSGHDPHSPVPPWSGSQFLLPPAQAEYCCDPWSYHSSPNPHLDSAFSFDIEAEPQYNSLHPPMLPPPVWDPDYLAPRMMYRNADTASLFTSNDTASVGPPGPITEWDLGSASSDVYLERLQLQEGPSSSTSTSTSASTSASTSVYPFEMSTTDVLYRRMASSELVGHGPFSRSDGESSRFLSVVSTEAGRRASDARCKGPARFSCEYCGATFTTKHNLRNHLKSHTSTQDCICEMCGRGFSTTHVLKRHEPKCNARRKPSGRSSKAAK